MKNLSIAWKLFILVGALLAATALVAISGLFILRQVNTTVAEMVDGTGKAMVAATRVRNRLLSSVLAERSSLLEDRDKESMDFADKAREHNAQAEKFLADLDAALNKTTGGNERRILDEFKRNYSEVLKVQKKVLELTVQNTNAKAKALLDGALAETMNRLRSQLTVQIQSSAKAFAAAEGKDVERVKKEFNRQRLAYFSITSLDKLRQFLNDHIDSQEESNMTRLDERIEQSLSELETATREILDTLPESEKPEGRALQVFLPEIRKQVTEVQRLSHLNTSNVSRKLSTTTGAEYTDAADKAIMELVDALKNHLDEDKASAQSGYFFAVLITLGVGTAAILLGSILGYFVNRGITMPVSRVVHALDRMAEGDLATCLAMDQKDEVGRMVQAMDRVGQNLGTLIQEVRGGAEGVTNSSGKLNRLASQLMSQAEETTSQAGTVAAGAEELNTTIQSMAGAAEEVSMNVSGISSASEQISVNIAGISSSATAASSSVDSVTRAVEAVNSSLTSVAQEANEGSRRTAEARDLAERASETITALDRSAAEITQVTGTIQAIALQTNLLALNATIEATAAGDAGKGFGVVAAEIKGLAQQSGQSAGEITRKINEVQESVRKAVETIRDIRNTFHELASGSDRISESVASQKTAAEAISRSAHEANQAVARIAQAINEVSKGSSDMARNAGEAARGATSVSANISEAARAARAISDSIQSVSQASRLNAESATSLNASAEELAAIADRMESSMTRFKLR